MIRITLSHPKCEPHIGSDASAGLDMRAFISPRDESAYIVLEPRQSVMLYTGVSVAIPAGWVGLAIPRSSLGRRKLKLTNTVGVIDSDYRGQVMCELYNYGTEGQVIENFERLFQLVIVPHYNPHMYEIVESLDDTSRGTGGFGSTGTK